MMRTEHARRVVDLGDNQVASDRNNTEQNVLSQRFVGRIRISHTEVR